MSRQVETWPDPLTFSDGRRVQNPEEWYGRRRAELRALFEREMYGVAPEQVEVSVDLLGTSPIGDLASLENWVLTIAAPKPIRVPLLVAIPHSEGPVPTLVALNFNGNGTVTVDDSVPLPASWPPGKRRGQEAEDWRLDRTVGKGFALVTAHYGAIEPDDPNGTGGIRSSFGGDYGWGAVAAWAWGLSRILDALLRDPRFDAGKIGVTGHSRLGKAALLAAAFDERFAFAAPVQSGCGGAAPSRGTVGESVSQITTSFPHWFTPAFAEHGSGPETLPFDQHSLMAMVAPRPILLANAAEDLWANPEGQVEALEEANRVYEFLGAGRPNETFLRPGGHRMGDADWEAVRLFAHRLR